MFTADWTFALVYLDEIVIVFKIAEANIKNVRHILTLLCDDDYYQTEEI